MAERIVGQSMFKLLGEAKALEREGKDIIHFEIGDTHLEMPSEVKAAAVASLKKGRTHYGDSFGEHNLRTTVLKVFREDYGFEPALGQVVVTTGANPLIYYLLAVLANPGEEVILTDPAFVTYRAAIATLNLRGVYVPVTHKNNFRFSPGEIEKKLTKKTRVIVVNSPSNPTGAVYSKEDLVAIYNIAKRHNCFLISDEIYAPFVYEGKHFSVGTLDKCRERVIVTSGFSKPFAMTGWRVGYGVGPEAVIQKIGLLSQTIVSCVPPFLQDACVTALEGRKKFSKVYLEEYTKLREIVCEELKKIPELDFAKPQGAFYLMIDVSRTGMTGDEFSAHLLRTTGVVVCPGSGFGEAGKNYVRLCYAINAAVKLREGCRRIQKAVKELGSH